MSATILDTILARKSLEIPLIALPPEPPPPAVSDVLAWFRGFRAEGRKILIAECKKASPSAGVIDPYYDPVSIALEYQKHGAAAISVLTDERFFQGSVGDLQAVAAAVRLPVLRKDFIIDERQIAEARWAGASFYLLIAGVMSVTALTALIQYGRALGMEPLVEVHSIDEFEQALQAGALIIGINNRDLRTFQTDIQTSVRLTQWLLDRPDGKEIRDEILVISESGIQTAADTQLLAPWVDGFLVGSSLMRGNRGILVRQFADS